jgi:hypothetical protein
MSTKLDIEIYYLYCTTENCGMRIRVAVPFGADESMMLTCRNGHVNEYRGSEVQSATNEVLTGIQS